MEIWVNTTAYLAGDTVYYLGVWYGCKVANTGQVPSATSTYWLKLNTSSIGFPSNVEIFTPAQDPSTLVDINNINTYQTYLNNGDFETANSFLASMLKGVEMNMNAGRYNAVLNQVVAIEQFYLGLDGVRAYINENIDKFSDIAEWDDTTTYTTGNLAAKNSNWYICTAENTNIEPSITTGWENYWSTFLTQQPAKQYQIAEVEPSGLEEGDLWFKITT